MADRTFDIEAARRNWRRREEARQQRLHELWLKAKDESDEAIRLLIEKYHPTRIIQWGSILRPERFSEISDIDIAVEGIDDMETWSKMERDLETALSFPLDLVRFDRLHPEHQKQILMRGEVVYERE